MSDAPGGLGGGERPKLSGGRSLHATKSAPLAASWFSDGGSAFLSPGPCLYTSHGLCSREAELSSSLVCLCVSLPIFLAVVWVKGHALQRLHGGRRRALRTLHLVFEAGVSFLPHHILQAC